MKPHFAALFLMACAAVAGVSAQPPTGTTYGHVVWSPNGAYIAFTRSVVISTSPFRMNSDIYISRPDGSELTKITGDNGNESFPDWSRDGKTIYFGSGPAGSREQEIYSVGVDGKGLRYLTRAPGRDGAPNISPNGRTIVFNSERDGGMPQIYVMNIDGSDPKRLTDDDKVAFYNPVWSPDGKKIVYYREIRDNKDQIWTMNADGSDKRLLTNNVGHNFYPSWSSDGRRILFTRMADERQQLYWIDADGSNLQPAAIDSFFGRQSPDGKRIAYIGVGDLRMQMIISNSDGSDPKVLFR